MIWIIHYTDVSFLPVPHSKIINQLVEKLVSFLVVCYRDFCDHCAGEQSSGPVQLPRLIVRHESGCLAISTLWQVSVHLYLILVQHVKITRGLARR